MTTNGLSYRREMTISGAGAPEGTAFAVLGAMPLVILAIEAVVGTILLLVSGLFFATIFFAFVGFVLIYVALWIAVLFNACGAAMSLLTLLAGRRYMTGKVFGISGLLIHAALLGAVVYSLAGIHSYLAQARGPLQQPGTSSETRQVEAWPAVRVEEMAPAESDESLGGEESNHIDQGFRAD